MDFLKKNVKWVIIILVILLGLQTCGRCSSSRQSKRYKKELVKKDSIIRSKDSQIKDLNYRIEVLNEKVYGYEKATQIQSMAIDKINEAKKNINVTVRRR